jgi:flavin reductase (DIM6/NTAB) family NADH-FMN oxidoreductase RutF
MNTLKEISPDMMNQNVFDAIGKQWMLVTAGNEEKANTMTASWGGLGVMFGKNAAYIFIRPQRYTREFIDTQDTFSLSFLDKSYRSILNYLGSASGRNEDKIAKSGLTLEYSDHTPYFKEADTVLICKKLLRQPFDHADIDANVEKSVYPNKDYHILYIAEITKTLQAEK